MKSTPTPWTHEAVTSEPLRVEFGASGSPLRYSVDVPAGTRCRKLDGGSDPWVVADLSFIEDKRSLLFHDADHYGIRIPEDKLSEIREVRSRPPERRGLGR